MINKDKILKMIKAFEEKMERIKKEKSPWISVDDELPNHMNTVLCLSKRVNYQDAVSICLYDDHSKDFCPLNLFGNFPIKVDYWMYIPKSPEE